MADDHRVALVVDPNFGARLQELAREMHVWVMRSADNEAVVRRLWQDRPATQSSESRLTLFGSPTENPEEACRDIVSTIQEHHGEHSHDAPLNVIEVFGVQPTPRIRDELAAWGFDVEASSEGFVASRIQR